MFMVKLLNLDVKFGGRVLFTDPKIPLARNPIPQISKQPQNGPKFFENNLLNHGCLVWTGAGIMELWSLEGDSSFQSHWELRFLVPHPAARLILWSMPSVRTPKAVTCGKGKPLPIEKIRKNGTCQALSSCITNYYWRPVDTNLVLSKQRDLYLTSHVHFRGLNVLPSTSMMALLDPFGGIILRSACLRLVD